MTLSIEVSGLKTVAVPDDTGITYYGTCFFIVLQDIGLGIKQINRRTHIDITIGPDVANVSSLEIKTNYLEPTRAGRLRAEGFILKSGYKLAFMEGRLYDAEGLLTATTSTVAKLARAR